jgi:hypothetical protein
MQMTKPYRETRMQPCTVDRKSIESLARNLARIAGLAALPEGSISGDVKKAIEQIANTMTESLNPIITAEHRVEIEPKGTSNNTSI